MPSQSQIAKGRTRVTKNTREEVHQDSRTQRERSRGDAERAALRSEMDVEMDAIDAILAENQEALANFKQQGGQ